MSFQRSYKASRKPLRVPFFFKFQITPEQLGLGIGYVTCSQFEMCLLSKNDKIYRGFNLK